MGEKPGDDALFLIEMMADLLYSMQKRILALTALLTEQGVLSAGEIEARMAAMDEATTVEVEFSNDPAHVAWRKLRRVVRDMQEGREDPGAERDAGGEAGPQ